MNTPMLLKNFEDTPVRYPVWCERKHDGIRAVVLVDEAGRGTAWSRYGRPLPAAQGIADQVAATMGPGHVVDGELDAGSWGLTQSAIKRKDPAGLVYRPWDALTLSEWTTGMSEAHLMKRRARLDPLRGVPGVEVVDGLLVLNEAALGVCFTDAIERKFEGVVIKDLHAPYVCGVRSGMWQKLKMGRREEW